MTFWWNLHHWLHPEVVIVTTSSAASDENVVKIVTFSFQWMLWNRHSSIVCIKAQQTIQLLSPLSKTFMMTSSNGSIFRVTCPLCGEFTGDPSQRPVTRSFDVFFDLHLNKRLRKQSWGCWFEMPLRRLWRHCNVIVKFSYDKMTVADAPIYLLIRIAVNQSNFVWFKIRTFILTLSFLSWELTFI